MISPPNKCLWKLKAHGFIFSVCQYYEYTQLEIKIFETSTVSWEIKS